MKEPFHHKYFTPEAIRSGLLGVLTGSILLVTACNSPAEEKYTPVFSKDSLQSQPLLLGVPGLTLYDNFKDFCQYLNTRLPAGTRIRAVAARDIHEFGRMLQQRELPVAMINGEMALQAAANGYSIYGKIDDDNEYRGLILTHKDSVITNERQLKHKRIACAGPDALAGTKMPLYYLSLQGLDINRDVQIVNVPSFESVFMNVALGKCFAGTAWNTAWKAFIKSRPDIASMLVVRWITPPLPNAALLIRNDVDSTTRRQLLQLIFNMQNDEEGKAALNTIGIPRIIRADSTVYHSIRLFLQKYNTLGISIS